MERHSYGAQPDYQNLVVQRNTAVIVAVVLLVLMLVVLAWWIPDRGALVVARENDRRNIARANVELLKALLTKLADVSGEKGAAGFLEIGGVFYAAAQFDTVRAQSDTLCAPSAYSMFGNAPANVSANHTVVCQKYPALADIAPGFEQGTIAVEQYAQALDQLAAALVQLDNAIVKDP